MLRGLSPNETATYGDSFHLSTSVVELDLNLTYGFCGAPLFDVHTGEALGIGAAMYFRPMFEGSKEQERFSHCIDLRVINRQSSIPPNVLAGDPARVH
jgi:hypothetical protein